jgi:hypothetical protein
MFSDFDLRTTGTFSVEDENIKLPQGIGSPFLSI